MYVRTPVEEERKRRIDVAAWAYAYEVENDPIVDDATYDRVAAMINPEMSTGRPDLDAFFRAEFSPHTGMWIHRHPEKHKLARITALKRMAGPRTRQELAAPQASDAAPQLDLLLP